MPGEEELSIDLESFPPSQRKKLVELALKSGKPIKDYLTALVSTHIAADWLPPTDSGSPDHKE